MREMCIKTIKTLHLHSGAELILGYVQFIWALSPTSRSVWRKLTIRKLCIKVLSHFIRLVFGNVTWKVLYIHIVEIVAVAAH